MQTCKRIFLILGKGGMRKLYFASTCLVTVDIFLSHTKQGIQTYYFPNIVTPENLQLPPFRELKEWCNAKEHKQRMGQFEKKKFWYCNTSEQLACMPPQMQCQGQYYSSQLLSNRLNERLSSYPLFLLWLMDFILFILLFVSLPVQCGLRNPKPLFSTCLCVCDQ